MTRTVRIAIAGLLALSGVLGTVSAAQAAVRPPVAISWPHPHGVVCRWPGHHHHHDPHVPVCHIRLPH